MRTILGTAVAVAALPGIAAAIGLDRSGQSIGILFEDGNYAELSFGRVFPDVGGTDLAVFGGRGTGEVVETFDQAAIGIKYQFDDRLSGALILDQPYGADISYPDATATEGSVAFGGTLTTVDSEAVTALARYRFNDAFSVHGGLRYQQISADVTLVGAAYGGLSGYRVSLENDGDLGYVIGAAYERPEIALRVALTYFSGTDHDLKTTETIGGLGVDAITGGLFGATSTTGIETPEAINLDFQTGIAPETLLFGSIRHARYADAIVSPVFYDANVDPGIADSSLTEIEDNTEYSLDIGRRFTDALSGSVAIGYEPEESDDLVSPLAPSNGRTSLTLGLSYAVSQGLELSGGVSYARLGDAFAETGTPDEPRSEFEDNDVFGFGLGVGYRF